MSVAERTKNKSVPVEAQNSGAIKKKATIWHLFIKLKFIGRHIHVPILIRPISCLAVFSRDKKLMFKEKPAHICL